MAGAQIAAFAARKREAAQRAAQLREERKAQQREREADKVAPPLVYFNLLVLSSCCNVLPHGLMLDLQPLAWHSLPLLIDSGGGGTPKPEDAQGTPTKSQLSQSILVYEDQLASSALFEKGRPSELSILLHYRGACDAESLISSPFWTP